MSNREPLAYSRTAALTCVIARGDDAADFLRRQLTEDPPDAADRFATAAWNDAKGRVRALFDVVRDDGGNFLLIAERDGLEDVLAKLRMFVLRSRVELTAADDIAVASIIGATEGGLDELGVALGASPGSAVYADGVAWMRLGPQLVRVVGPEEQLNRIGQALSPTTPERIDLEEIRLGLPRVAAVAERYVPQMLNLDRLGAVSFTKGCYPGQEVVARLHHLGSVKRRLCRFVGGDAAASLPVPGTPLVDNGGREVGQVVRAAPADQEIELLAVAQLDAADGPLFLNAPGGAPLVRAPLPQDDS